MNIMNLKLHHISINVTDMNRSLAFYAMLGMEVFYAYEDNDVVIKHLTNGDFIIELFSYSHRTVDFQPSNIKSHSSYIGCEHFSLFVEDINSAYIQLKKFCDLNEIISLGRTDIKYFFIKDPDGVRIEIVEDKRSWKY